jgi:hypothetical protein
MYTDSWAKADDPERVSVSGMSEDQRAGKRWIAALDPPREGFAAATRAYFEELYGTPARELGYTQWGIKEVALIGEDIDFLAAVYPSARFVFLIRDPVDAYLSFRRYVVLAPSSSVAARGLHWVGGPAGFAAVWNSLAARMTQMAGLVNAQTFRYEESKGNPEFVARLGQFLGCPLNESLWGTVVEGDECTDGARLRRPTGSALERLEGQIVRRLTRAEAIRWGY